MFYSQKNLRNTKKKLFNLLCPRPDTKINHSVAHTIIAVTLLLFAKYFTFKISD